jgi:hypothetical protein
LNGVQEVASSNLVTQTIVVADYISFAAAFLFHRKNRLSLIPSLLLSASKQALMRSYEAGRKSGEIIKPKIDDADCISFAAAFYFINLAKLTSFGIASFIYATYKGRILKAYYFRTCMI